MNVPASHRLRRLHYRMFSCFPALLGETRGVSPAISRPLMKKHILIAATAALLALPNLSSTVLAASPEASEDAGAHYPRFSAEDFAAFTDAHIAALKVGLKLTPAQEKNWPPLEMALREQAKERGGMA